jgi:hypothetical protein
LVERFKDGAEITWDLPLNHEYYYIKGYFIEYWLFSSKKKDKSSTLPGQRTKLKGYFKNWFLFACNRIYFRLLPIKTS